MSGDGRVLVADDPFSRLMALLFLPLTDESLAENGALKVNQHLQVRGFDRIYAVGDCANVKEPKMAYHAGLHAEVAVTNIINSITGKPLVSYRTGDSALFAKTVIIDHLMGGKRRKHELP